MSAPEPRVVALVENFDAGYFFAGMDAGRFYFQTTLDAPRGRVIAMNPQAPGRSHWQVIVPEGEDAMDIASGSVTLVDHQLIVGTLHDAHSKVTIYGLDGRVRREIVLPGLGTASGFEGEPMDTETFYTYTDLITPATIYRLDLETGASTVYRAPKVAFDRNALESKLVFYPGKDGTRIPLFLVYRKGLRLEGANPTLLYGYGGFGIPMVPRFSAARLAMSCSMPGCRCSCATDAYEPRFQRHHSGAAAATARAEPVRLGGVSSSARSSPTACCSCRRSWRIHRTPRARRR